MKNNLIRILILFFLILISFSAVSRAAGTDSIAITVTVSGDPSAGGISPSSGASIPDAEVNFTAAYSDPNGWQDLSIVYLLINTTLDNNHCVSARYDRNANKLYLFNDAGTAWLGGYSPGSGNIIENSYGKLDCSGVVVSGSDTNLTVKWRLIFKDAFAGAESKKLYLCATDSFNATSGFIQKGSWLIDNMPPTGSIVINQGSPYTNSTSVTLNLSAQDSGSGLDKMQFSNDNIIWSGPEPYAATKTWPLSPGYGIKAVYARFSDATGNWSAVYSDTIMFGVSDYYFVSRVLNSAGQPQESSSYKFNNSLSEPAIGALTGQNYSVKTGFFYSTKE